MKFSERIGKTNVRTLIQVDSIEVILENKLWNNILVDYFDKIGRNNIGRNIYMSQEVCKAIWVDFYNQRIDKIPSSNYKEIYVESVISYIEEWYFKSEWFEKYDLIEFLVNLMPSLRNSFSEACNNTLKSNLSGFRFVSSKLVQITSEEEVIEIENALINSNKYKSVETHLETALQLLSNRETPDYRNSIKESISAVESIAKLIVQNEKTTLGKALFEIEKKHHLPNTLKKAFSALYNYTSDVGGIRHALIEEGSNVELEEARVMLITCSAFVNYLITKL